MFVSEKTIDQVINHLESTDFEREVTQFGKAQPALMAYIFSEDFELLTQEERELLLYMLLVIWQSVLKTQDIASIPPLSTKALEMAEEANWVLLEGVSAKQFRERMTVFFDNSDQEDLLAFVEDTLTDDEDDSIVTKEGREPLFIAAKTVIDALCS